MRKHVKKQACARKAALAMVTGLSFGVVGCDQPLPKCNVAQSLVSGGNFAARYRLEAGSKTGEGDCDTLQGETLYFGTFYKRNSDDTPNYDQVSVGIQPESTLGPLQNAAGAGVSPNPDDKPYAYGQFDRPEPNDDDLCSVSELDPARVRLPDAPEWQTPDPEDQSGETLITVPAAPAIDLQYQFSNVQVYMTARSPGRQVSADLTYTKDGCTAKYKVTALFPATSCGVGVVDEMGNETGMQTADNSLCVDNTTFSADDVECDPTLLLCVLKGDIPSLR